MGDVRDPERDQPLPKPGGLPVQAILIAAIRERSAYGMAKYGDVLRTGNGRDALKDAWEELVDFTSYFTQYVLEQGVILPGMEEAPQPEAEHPATAALEEKLRRRAQQRLLEREDLASLIPKNCAVCRHEPHVPGGCRSDAPSGLVNCQCGIEVALAVKDSPDLAICPNCRHEAHGPGRCTSKALGMFCSCTEAV